MLNVVNSKYFQYYNYNVVIFFKKIMLNLLYFFYQFRNILEFKVQILIFKIYVIIIFQTGISKWVGKSGRKFEPLTTMTAWRTYIYVCKSWSNQFTAQLARQQFPVEHAWRKSLLENVQEKPSRPNVREACMQLVHLQPAVRDTLLYWYTAGKAFEKADVS